MSRTIRVTGTLTETLTVQKEVTVEVPIHEGEEVDSPEVEERIENLIREEAYKTTVSDGTGWELTDSQNVEINYKSED